MKSFFTNEKYGEVIPGLTIEGKPAPYGVVNEREVRAAAGTMFAIGFATFFVVFFTKNYVLLNVVVTFFWLDFFLKTVFAPRWSIFGFLGRLFVKGQRMEYVGAIQKRFAWSIGLFLASIMLVFVVGFGVFGWLPIVVCGTCLFFMWMESALGICVGCKIYGILVKKGVLPEPEHRPACPGGVCAVDPAIFQKKS
ncbi:MAG: DUF4395 domain-containing protein [Candidatus Moranbacteria bacterium]|nr:DUF4395 domain-containing protein [Candidatus Moranbacteria bacterium]